MTELLLLLLWVMVVIKTNTTANYESVVYTVRIDRYKTKTGSNRVAPDEGQSDKTSLPLWVKNYRARSGGMDEHLQQPENGTDRTEKKTEKL